MSLQSVAQLAGVSTSTVSRVVHDHPSVARETASAVRQVMERLRFTPSPRRAGRPRRVEQAGSLGFVVLGTSGTNTAPAFEKLLRGVSSACTDNGLRLTIGFVSADAAHAPQWLANGEVDGLLLHGEQPTNLAPSRLRDLPAVWLMANRHRPSWGDQVMPNNAVIGDLAARYLVRRGHRRLAHLGVGGDAWSLKLRAFAFVRAAGDAGAAAEVLEAPADAPATAQAAAADYWCADGLASAADLLVEQLVNRDPASRPTGLFVAEDRLLPEVDAAFRRRGLRCGPGADAEIVSCNNARPHHVGLQSQPAVIDIHPEAIGRRGVEQLIWRMRNRDVCERVRTMVDPVLIEPAVNGNGDGTRLAATVMPAAGHSLAAVV